MAERSPEITHKIMSSVKQKNTEPELLLRKALWHKGLRYRTNYRKLPGKPDIVFSRAKLAVFVDGDYWHGHNWAVRGYGSLEEELKRYSPFWQNKIKNNIDHDQKVTSELQKMGWTVLRVWESEIIKDLSAIVELIESQYKSSLCALLTRKSSSNKVEISDDYENKND